MFVPSSLRMLGVFSTSLVDAGLQLSVPVDRGMAEKVVLACWGFDTKKSLEASISDNSPSKFDEAVPRAVWWERRFNQVKVVAKMLAVSEEVATLLVFYWQPTNRPYKRDVMRLTDALHERSDDPGPYTYNNLTFESLARACASKKHQRDWSWVGELAVIGIHASVITRKELFWEYLTEAADHDLAARLNLGAALLQVDGPRRDPKRGAEILRGIDIRAVNVKMREVVLVSLGQFEEGKHGGRKDLRAAAKLYLQAFEECGSLHAAIHLGILLIDTGDFEQAQRFIRHAVKWRYPPAMITAAKMMLLRQMPYDEKLLYECLDGAEEAGITDAIVLREIFDYLVCLKPMSATDAR